MEGRQCLLLYQSREIVSIVTEVSRSGRIGQILLAAGLTNVVALAIGRKTIDSSIFNRRLGRQAFVQQ